MTERTNTPPNENDLATQTLHTAAQLNVNHILVNRFKIIASLGQGAQGNVYHAYDQLLEVDVAIKVVQSELQDYSHLDVIRNEVLLARQLQHKNIIPIFDVFEDQGLVFFTMEYIQGEPLIKRLEQPLSQADFELWTKQLFSALNACESAQIKHGDIKPDNILIDQNNNLRLIDFGIGQSLHSQDKPVSGHQDFSAPEVLYGGLSGTSSELFSAGKTIQLMLAGVTLASWSLTARMWQAKQQKFVSKLCHDNPLKRPTLAQARDFYHTQLQTNYRIKVALSFGLVIAVCVAIWLAAKIDWLGDAKPSLPADTIQLSVIHDGQSGLLQSLIELLEMPLRTNAQLSVIESTAIQEGADNLGLKPAAVAEDRVNIATLFNLQALIVLNVDNIQGNNFLVRASVYSMPANSSVLEHAQSVNANQLDTDLSQFASVLFTKLEEQLAQQFDASEVQLLAKGVEALGKQQNQVNSQGLTAKQLTLQNPNYAGAWFQAAESAWLQGDLQSAQEHLENLFALPNSSSYWLLNGRLLQADMTDDLALAQQSVQQLIKAFPDRAELLAKSAQINQWAGNLEAGIADYQQAVSLTPNDPDLWFQLAVLKITSGDLQGPVENELVRALVLYRQNNDIAGEGIVLNAFGVTYLRRAEYDISEKYLKDALTLYDLNSYTTERAKPLANLALIYSIKGRFVEAEAAVEDAISILKEVGDLQQQADVLDSMGVVLEEQGLYKQALEYFKRGLDIRSVSGDSLKKAQSMSNVAYMHFLIGDFSLADIYWQQAKSLFAENNEQSHLHRTLLNLAQLGLAKGDHLKAARYLTQVSSELDVGQKQELMINKLLYSYLNFSDGALTNALANLEEARELAEQTNDSRALTEVNLWHAEICLRIADQPCLQNYINQATETVSEKMVEQQALLNWLQYGADLFNSDIAVRDPQTIVNNLIKLHIPVLSEMKILLDLQERLDLPMDSSIMQRLEKLVKPIYYQQYMHFLYLRSSDPSARQSLYTQLLSHPKYWRNHLYYQLFDDPKSKQKQQQLSAEWFSQLSEQQAKRYREHYLEF